MSKYDYPDPGQDPAYCDGLADDDPPPTCETCAWCDDPYAGRAEYPYCSTLCAVQAEVDTSESRGDSYV